MALNTKGSVVDLMKSKGMDSSYNNRSTLANKYGIKNYTGTAQQNQQLMGYINKPTTTAKPPTTSTAKPPTTSTVKPPTTTTVKPPVTTQPYKPTDAQLKQQKEWSIASGMNGLFNNINPYTPSKGTNTPIPNNPNNPTNPNQQGGGYTTMPIDPYGNMYGGQGGYGGYQMGDPYGSMYQQPQSVFDYNQMMQSNNNALLGQVQDMFQQYQQQQPQYDPNMMAQYQQQQQQWQQQLADLQSKYSQMEQMMNYYKALQQYQTTNSQGYGNTQYNPFM